MLYFIVVLVALLQLLYFKCCVIIYRGDVLKIGLFADSHVCTFDLPDGRLPTLSLTKIADMLEDFKVNGVELIVCLGDLMHYEENAEQNEINIRNVAQLFDGYPVRRVLIRGNHDCEIYSREVFENKSGFELSPLCIDTGSSKRLIMLDASYSDDGSEYQPPYNDWTNSYIPPRQLEWFRGLLADKSLDCTVFVHQCLDYSAEHHHLIRNAVAVNSIIADSGNVSHVYMGHYHPGAESTVNGVEYSTLRALSFGTENNYMIIDI